MVYLAASLRAADFTLDWTTLDGGGEQLSAGGEFTLSVTVGQPDAGPSGAGGFSLQSGFWAGITDEPGWTIPVLRIGWIAQQPAVIWPADATNWTLQATAALAPAGWSDVGAVPIATGGEFMVSIDSSEPRMKYRLSRQP